MLATKGDPQGTNTSFEKKVLKAPPKGDAINKNLITVYKIYIKLRGNRPPVKFKLVSQAKSNQKFRVPFLPPF